MINLELSYSNANFKHRTDGFTLIEIAIVLLIVSLLLGSILGPLASQERNRKINIAKTTLEEVHEALLGFAAINGYLPCPANPVFINPPAGVAGVEARVAGAGSDCSFEHGYVPHVALGLNGRFNADQIFVDPWGSPYQYSLNNDANWEYAKSITFTSSSSFDVCSTSACPAGSTLASGVVAVLFSRGPLGLAATASLDQLENTNGDNNFVSHEPREGAVEFDDIVLWLSNNELVLNLVKSGQL